MLRQGSTSSRRQFEHKFFPLEDLSASIIDGKRYYQLPDGTLAMSVTSVLSTALDKSGLYEWRSRIGDAEADRIMGQAATRGTAVHLLAERYLMNDPNWKKGAMPVNLFSFSEVRPLLDRHIGTIYALEAPLYSHRLSAAGRTDCVADWDGVPTIVDFKTSRKPKKEEWIQGYFLQATTYAIMMAERTGLEVPRFAIVVAVDGSEPQLFTGEIAMFKDQVESIFISKRQL